VTTRISTIATLLAALAVAAAACGGTSGETTSTGATTVTPTPEATVTTTVAPAASTPSPTTSSAPGELPQIPDGIAVPPTLEGLPLAYVAVDDEPLLVAVAATRSARRQGLMAVTDLQDLDGMLFTWAADTAGGFWMRDTVLPLDIAFFDVDGDLVVTFPMEPCDQGARCPVYDPGAEYRYALETAQGRLDRLADGARLTLPEGIAGSR
jgi:uncharacterized membrane protein (UPF0127 family)